MTNIIKTLTQELFNLFKKNLRQSKTNFATSIVPSKKEDSTTITPNKKIKNDKIPSTKKMSESEKIAQYLKNHYDFRYNVLTEQTEYRTKGKIKENYALLNERELNTICIEIQNSKIHCWDRDLARYIHSSFITSYHPFKSYLEELPSWDKTDRLTDLAQRVSYEPHWVLYFHRWMLAVTAQWMGINNTHANSLAPLLISTTQGLQKSTFCKSLLPSPLQIYYTDQLDLVRSNMGSKLAQMGLINLDEFDRLSPKQMAQLKNWMQAPSLNIRKAYKSHFSQLPRIASFIGTSNRKDLLTDPTGSRRFLCIEVEHPIDCSNLEHAQIYAQLKYELQTGARYWFTNEDEKNIQEYNSAFYQTSPEEEIFCAHFRAATNEEKGELLSLAEIIEILRSFHKGILHSLNLAKFGNALVSSGVERIHTHVGNRYRVVRIGEGCEG